MTWKFSAFSDNKTMTSLLAQIVQGFGLTAVDHVNVKMEDENSKSPEMNKFYSSLVCNSTYKIHGHYLPVTAAYKS